MSVQEWMEKTFHFTPRSFLVRVLPKNGMSGMPLGKMGLYLLELYGTEYTRPYCYCTRWGETFFFIVELLLHQVVLVIWYVLKSVNFVMRFFYLHLLLFLNSGLLITPWNCRQFEKKWLCLSKEEKSLSRIFLDQRFFFYSKLFGTNLTDWEEKYFFSWVIPNFYFNISELSLPCLGDHNGLISI